MNAIMYYIYWIFQYIDGKYDFINFMSVLNDFVQINLNFYKCYLIASQMYKTFSY